MRKDTGREVLMERVEYTKTGKKVIHGTLSAYQLHGCRCFICKRNKAESVDRWKKRKNEVSEKKMGCFVRPEEYAPYMQKHIERGLSVPRIAKATGLSYQTVLAMKKRQIRVQAVTFERIKSLPDVLPPEEPKVEEPPMSRSEREIVRLRKQRFRAIFQYFRQGGFDDELLSERLGITPTLLQRFVTSGFEDVRIGMRVCQLHHVLRQGE